MEFCVVNDEKIRLIDANALHDEIDRILRTTNTRELSRVIAHAMIENANTVDAVTVVRCKDCAYYTPTNYTPASKGFGKCVFLIGKNQYKTDNGFCDLGTFGKDGELHEND